MNDLYQVNELNNLLGLDDLLCADVQNAIDSAVDLCEEYTENVFGIWQDETLLYIVFEGEVFARQG